MFLFDVGFQLSYLAVLAIVSIQPVLYKIWKPKWVAIDFLWNIFTVTIAAQLGVLPISLYYFHQFPGLFFVSNLVIIPFLGLILAYGIILILLSLCNLLPEIAATIYAYIIGAMNTVVDWVAKQEQFLLKDISITLLQVIISYLLILALLRLFKKRTFASLRLAFVSILLFQGALILNSYANATQEFIIFHKNRFTLIGEKNGANLKLVHNLDSIALVNDRIIKNFKVGNFINNTANDTIKNIFQIKTKKLLVLDSFGIYQVKSFKPNYVLLRNSPKVNLQRLIDSLHPEIIIADGSNYKSYIDRWKATCSKQKLPFHDTGENGAFIIQ